MDLNCSIKFRAKASAVIVLVLTAYSVSMRLGTVPMLLQSIGDVPNVHFPPFSSEYDIVMNASSRLPEFFKHSKSDGLTSSPWKNRDMF